MTLYDVLVRHASKSIFAYTGPYCERYLNQGQEREARGKRRAVLVGSLFSRTSHSLVLKTFLSGCYVWG